MSDKLSYICVAAALLATLSYTCVLTPPHEYSDCQDICVTSMSKFVEVFLETQRILGAMPPVNATKVESVSGLSQATSTDLFTNRNIVNANLRAEDLDGAGQKKGPFASPLQAFFVLNAVALFSSVSCLVLACLANSQDNIEKICSTLLTVSAIAAYCAFVIAHFQVYYTQQFDIALVLLLALAIAFAMWTVFYALGWSRWFLGRLTGCWAMVIRITKRQLSS